jgi:hypothetical protein
MPEIGDVSDTCTLCNGERESLYFDTVLFRVASESGQFSVHDSLPACGTQFVADSIRIADYYATSSTCTNRNEDPEQQSLLLAFQRQRRQQRF